MGRIHWSFTLPLEVRKWKNIVKCRSSNRLGWKVRGVAQGRRERTLKTESSMVFIRCICLFWILRQGLPVLLRLAFNPGGTASRLPVSNTGATMTSWTSSYWLKLQFFPSYMSNKEGNVYSWACSLGADVLCNRNVSVSKRQVPDLYECVPRRGSWLPRCKQVDYLIHYNNKLGGAASRKDWDRLWVKDQMTGRASLEMCTACCDFLRS